MKNEAEVKAFFARPDVTPSSCRLGGKNHDEFWRVSGSDCVQKYAPWEEGDKFGFGVIVQRGNTKIAPFSQIPELEFT